ncbi:MAG: hypothetical protein LBR19_03590 [Bifidobacteriaceae bacterium]|nr:hypothetical protein [Bifidobacteriaceae bacterium]
MACLVAAGLAATGLVLPAQAAPPAADAVHPASSPHAISPTEEAWAASSPTTTSPTSTDVPASATDPASTASATEAAPPLVPSQFIMGASSHLGTMGNWATRAGGQTLPQIAMTELGATSLRDEINWANNGDHPTAEQQAVSQAAVARLLEVPQYGGKLLLILDYSNSAHVAGGYPNTTAEREAFARYAQRVIAAYGPQNLAAIEIWNEWNSSISCASDPVRSQGCPTAYAKLVEDLVNPSTHGLATPSLRDMAPGVPILAGAVNGSDLAWSQVVLNYLRDHDVAIDGWSLHPYHTATGCASYAGQGYNSQEFAALCTADAKVLTTTAYGQTLPIWVTEIGWSTAGLWAIGQKVQAELLVNVMVRLRAVGGVPAVYWYDLLDDATALDTPTDDPFEDGFGLITRIGSHADHTAGATKQSGVAYAKLAGFWRGCTDIAGAIAVNREFALTCPGGQRRILLDPTSAELQAALADGWTLVDLLGQAADVAPGGQVPASWVGYPVGLRSRLGDKPLGIASVALTGTPQIGATLTVTAAGVSPAGQAVTYTWFRGTSRITAATGTTYQLTPADGGQDIVVKATVSLGGLTVAKYSNHLQVADGVTVSQPVLFGPAAPGGLITAGVNYGPAGAAVTFAWFRGTSLIGGATGPSYRLTAADAGQTVSFKVTVALGVQTVVKYSERLAVLGVSALTVSGQARVGQVLTATAAYLPADAPVTYTWYRGTAVVGSGAAYLVQAADATQDMVVKVTVTKSGVGTAVKYSAHFTPAA